jgi:hypothetical protein
MKLKMTGLVFATFEPVKKEIIVDLGKNVEMSIQHNDVFSIVSVGESEYYLETDSLEYSLFTA